VRERRAGIAAVVLALAVAGCSSSARQAGGDAASSTKPAATLSSAPSVSASSTARSLGAALPAPWDAQAGTPAQRAAAAAAMAVYQGMWRDLAQLGRTAAYSDPRMAEYMIDQPLTDWTKQFAKDKHNGVVALGQPQLAPRVVSVTPADHPTRVEIADCFDNSHWLQYYSATGKLVDNKPGGRFRTEAAVTLDPRRRGWVVSQQIFGLMGSC
jgi:hypothetical protein